MYTHIRAALVGAALLVPVASHAATLLSDFDGGGTTAGRIFQDPDFSGSTDSLIAGSPDSTAIAVDPTNAANHALNVQFAFVDNSPNDWLRLTTSGSNPVVSESQAVSMDVLIASGDALNFGLGLREVAYASDPAIGSNGSGASTGIEWVGVDASGAAPKGLHHVTTGSWQTLTFLIPSEPVSAFTGDGILNGKFGKANLEHLLISSPTNSTSAESIFIDNLRVTDASSVPEPGVLALLGTGVLPLLAARRRRQ